MIERLPSAKRTDTAQPSVLVLITIDGVRWQDVLNGVDRELARYSGLRADEVVAPEQLMPELRAAISNRGVLIGSDMGASGPNFVSLPGYLEMLTGSPSECPNNDCAASSKPTILDLAARDAAAPRDVAVFASWSGIAKAIGHAPDRLVLSAGREQVRNQREMIADRDVAGAFARGRSSPAFPGHGDYRPDAHTAELALRYFDAYQPRLVFVGLGDTDEYAHRRDYRSYLAALRHADRVIGAFNERLQELVVRGVRAHLVVTTDHGRSDAFEAHGKAHPESQRVWAAIIGSHVSARGVSAPAAPARLADVAPTMGRLLELPTTELNARGRSLDEFLAPTAVSRPTLARN